MVVDFQTAAAQLIEAGRELHALGMVPATSGNFSAKLDDGRIAITVSGRHKGRLTEADIMLLDADGKPLDQRRPSAETGLHLQLYRRYPMTRGILHPHSQAATLTAHRSEPVVVLQGYELLKAFEGITTHQTRLEIPMFDNDQDIDRLAARVDDYMNHHEGIRAYLIRGHGLYCWGSSVDAALRQCEALEFLLQSEFKSAGQIR